MSLITQCPACSTMFRVVPDQLRISEGWVRCGQCDEVFDANAHLRNLEAVAGASESTAPPPEFNVQRSDVPQQGTKPETTLLPAPEQMSPAYDWGAVLSEPDQSVEPQALPEQADWAEPVAQPESMAGGLQAGSDFDQDPPNELLANGGAELPDTPLAEDEWTPTLHASLESDGVAPGDLVAQRLDALAEDPPPSFMGKPPAAASRWLGTKTLVSACSLLMLVLLGQVLLHERNRIAAAVPALQPGLAAACQVFACTVSAPQDIESIAIDSSTFTSVRPGVYLLHVSLKNTATLALATPALELTLTDLQDQPLLRRVVLPAELTGNSSLAAGAEWGASLPISVKTGATPQKIAGYKLLAFYP